MSDVTTAKPDPIAIQQRSARAAYGLVFAGMLITLLIAKCHDLVWDHGFTSDHLALHLFLELIGIVVSFVIACVGWATYRRVQSFDILWLGMMSFAVTWLDFAHAMTFPGMPNFFGPSETNRSIYFWLASRFTGATCFLITAILHRTGIRVRTRNWIPWLGLMIAGTWAIFCYYVILEHSAYLPLVYIPGAGLTTAKVIFEEVAMGVSFVAGILLLTQEDTDPSLSYRWLGCAALIFTLSGYYFTHYHLMQDLFMLAGHIFKAIAYVLVFRAVFVECVSIPYERMRALADEASEANAAKTRFLANVSHEFRTPLGVIAGFSDLLARSKTLDAEARRWSEMIGRNSRSLRLLIDDLLDLSKAETENMTIERRPFDLALVVSDVAAALRLQAEQKGVRLVFENDLAKGAVVASDELRLRQVLINVLGNAVKFTSQGEVRAVLRPGPFGPELSVRDTGIGIETSQIARLFKPFAQADNPLNRRFGGTGLGLVLAKKLARLLGGDLNLVDSHVGRGTHFVVNLPELIEAPTAPSDTTNKQSLLNENQPPELGAYHILAVDDSADNLELLEYYLAPTHARVTLKASAEEALRGIEHGHYNLILMDIQMPEIDGFEATRRLRARGWTKPILALTAHAHGPERERALASGFDGYLVKPITMEELWSALVSHL